MKETLLAVLLAAPVSAFAGGDAAFLGALQAGRQTLARSFQEVSWTGNEEQSLLDALNDNRPEVRVQALKGLKAFVQNSYRSRDAVIDHLNYTSEDLSVRREAARSLTRAAGDWKVRDELLKHFKDSNNPAPVRSMAAMSLYWQAQYDDRVRDELVDYARRGGDAQVRLAAIWALMYAGGDNDVRRDLLDLARRGGDEAVRTAAAKSLYSQMSDGDVNRFASDAAERGSSEERYAAIMLLSARRFDSDTRLLEDIAKRDSDPRARMYAVTALGGHTHDTVLFFHLNEYQRQGRVHRLVSEAIDRE